jgi:hypothetical protein
MVTSSRVEENFAAGGAVDWVDQSLVCMKEAERI